MLKRKSKDELLLFDVKNAVKSAFGREVSKLVIDRGVILAKEDPGRNAPGAAIVIIHDFGIPTPEEAFNAGSDVYERLAEELADIDDLVLEEVGPSVSAVYRTSSQQMRPNSSRRSVPALVAFTDPRIAGGYAIIVETGGSPSKLGKTLLNHYDTVAKARALVERGNAQRIGTNLTKSEFFHRDHGDRLVRYPFADFQDLFDLAGAYYHPIYWWHGDRWKIALGGQRHFKVLTGNE